MSDQANEPSLDPALKKLEACLAERLVASPAAIDRDQLLYRAGWEAAKEKRPVATWRWPIATGVMTAATVALAFLQIDTQRRLEGLEQRASVMAVVETVPEIEIVPSLEPPSTRQKRPAWPLLAAWGWAPSQPAHFERGRSLRAHGMLRDGLDPLEEWDRTARIDTERTDVAEGSFPSRQPSTARELMEEWFPTPVRPVPVRAAPSPPSSTDPAQQRARIYPTTAGGSVV